MVWDGMASSSERAQSPTANGVTEKKNGLSKTLSTGSGGAQIGLYEFDRRLGSGSFAVVRLARHQITKSEVAVKIIDKLRLDEDGAQRVEREVQTLKQVSHPNVLRLYQVMELQNTLYLVTEYCTRGDLFEIVSKRGRIQEPHARHIFCQVASAANYLHSQCIAHRDLKAENILLTTQGQVKIADFGFSTTFARGEKLKLWCGSPPYAAPEMFLGQEYDGPAADVWSLGVLLYVMVCGALPFEGSTIGQIKAKVLEGRYRIPFFLSNDCEKLIKRMLSVDQAHRINTAAIQNHVWCSPVMDQLRRAQDMNVEHSQLPRQRLGAMSFPTREAKGSKDEQHGLRLLRLIKEFGIDVHATYQSVHSRSFDHHYAIYHLFAERLRSRDTQLSAQQQVQRQLGLAAAASSVQGLAENPTKNVTSKVEATQEEKEDRVPLWQPLPRPPDIQISTVESMDVDLPPTEAFSPRPRGRSSTSTLPRASIYDASPGDNSIATPTCTPDEAAAAMLPCFTMGRRSSDGAALRGDAIAFRQRLQPLQVHEARTFTSSVIAEEPLDLSPSPMNVA